MGASRKYRARAGNMANFRRTCSLFNSYLSLKGMVLFLRIVRAALPR